MLTLCAPKRDLHLALNGISILVLKPWESNPGPQKTPCTNQEGQEPASLPAIKTEILILVLKATELNLELLRMNCTNQDEQGPTNLPGHRLKLLDYPATCWLNKGDSLNGHQIAASPVPLRTQTYTEVVACLKEVKMRSDTGPDN
ncbi:hypothetical protein DSO57_1013710 [Entomophthora muscae]|uniref:Uncharacterized protein n=1 Tax=Entomophthora muscae TaxID=34485 RepID=A0ACC2TGS2_9FUNG|nr:hypothetical protein DSO57_1013710 [Entomophthora muscae]